MELGLQVEVAGCPTICKHCWAQGVPYDAMPVEDIRWVLEEARRFCQENGMVFGSFPMHEVAAHPHAPEVMRLYREALGSDPGFEPLATTGVPIAMREDWEAFLTAIGATGTTTFWVAFHGFGAGHDRLAHREGAFQEICLAVRRIRSLGFRCGANVFVTRDIVQHFEAMADTLKAIGLNEMSWEPAHYYPTARSRQYEAQRPELAEVLPIAGRIQGLSRFWKDKWGDLETYTEARWVRRAIEGDGPAAWEPADYVGLVCRSNFDVHTGKAGLYGPRHGNLKQHGVTATLQRAVQAGFRSDDRLYLRADSFPPLEELAQRFGDAQGRTVHFDAPSVRYRWLDRVAAGRTASKP